MSESIGEYRDGVFTREMTVARVRERPGADHVEVMFCESARFYRLPRASPQFDQHLRLLKRAGPAGRRLTIVLGSLESDVIEGVEGGRTGTAPPSPSD